MARMFDIDLVRVIGTCSYLAVFSTAHVLVNDIRYQWSNRRHQSFIDPLHILSFQTFQKLKQQFFFWFFFSKSLMYDYWSMMYQWFYASSSTQDRTDGYATSKIQRNSKFPVHFIDCFLKKSTSVCIIFFCCFFLSFLFSGGLSNFLYYCALPAVAKPKQGEPSRVLVRFYGQIHSEGALEAILTESVIFTLLSERKLGPKLYGIFPGGRLEEFIPVIISSFLPILFFSLDPFFSYQLAESLILHTETK